MQRFSRGSSGTPLPPCVPPLHPLRVPFIRTAIMPPLHSGVSTGHNTTLCTRARDCFNPPRTFHVPSACQMSNENATITAARTFPSESRCLTLNRVYAKRNSDHSRFLPAERLRRIEQRLPVNFFISNRTINTMIKL